MIPLLFTSGSNVTAGDVTLTDAAVGGVSTSDALVGNVTVGDT